MDWVWPSSALACSHHYYPYLAYSENYEVYKVEYAWYDINNQIQVAIIKPEDEKQFFKKSSSNKSYIEINGKKN